MEKKKMSKKGVIVLVAILLSLLVISILIYKLHYWTTLHPMGQSFGVTYFDESLGYRVPEPNEETGLVEYVGAGGSSNMMMQDCILTVKGEIRSGYLHYEVYDENGNTAFEADFPCGEYDEEYNIGFLGYSYEDYATYPPETKGLIDIDLYPKTTGFELDGLKKH